MTLTLFPTLVKRRTLHDADFHSPASSLSSLPDATNRPFTERLISAIAEELDYLFRWDLPVSTVVRFNEDGEGFSVDPLPLSKQADLQAKRRRSETL